MIDIDYIREHTKEVKDNNANRNVSVDVDRLLQLDQDRRATIVQIEELRAQRNQGSKGKPSAEDIEKLRATGDAITVGEHELAQIESQYRDLLMQVPNLTHPASPVGGEEDYVVLQEGGTVPSFAFTPRDHEDLLTSQGMLDFERATKVSGSKFFYTQGDLVRLNQALLAYGMDVASEHGYQLVETPDLARDEILTGIGFNPRGPETQIYSIENSDLSLIGTAEITMGGYHAGEILDLSAGPKKYAALSHCFRTEAGAYGRESKGLYRVHQFTKLELFAFCAPADSEHIHAEMKDLECKLAGDLGLAYRVIDIPTGDLGGPAYRKYDVEAWMVMKNGYGEITSSSNCTDYQARRLNIRYRTNEGKTAFVHTLNGTAVNTSRWPLALVEQYQQADGSISIPPVLRPYMGGREVLGR
jgi:seryl-tRNA synthetase